MSTRSSDTVEWVVNSSPHEQRTVVTLYSGGMPCFIVVAVLTSLGFWDPIPGTTCDVPAFHSPGPVIGVAWRLTPAPIPLPWCCNGTTRLQSVDIGPLDVAEELGVGLGLAHPVHDQLQCL